jgi:hypothetical protein
MTAMKLYNTITGESRMFPQVQADHLARNSYGEWTAAKALPAGWNRELPTYKVTRDLKPSPKQRFKFETPFSHQTDSDEYQYGERILKAGEVITTDKWPHASMMPLNETARRVLEFFGSHQKSRLPQTPWVGGRLRLDDGLSGAPPQHETLRPPSAPSLVKPIRVAR